jgi:hypothetical protein
MVPGHRLDSSTRTGRVGKFSNKILKIAGQSAANRDALAGARMHKLKMRGMQSDASNQLLRRFRVVVFPITDDRVTYRRKLYPDLILQSCGQLNLHKRRIGKNAFDGISKFGANRLGVSCRPQLLKHSFASKIVNQRSCLRAEMTADYCEISSHGSMREKLSHERISIPIRLRKQQNPGGVTIDAMHDHPVVSSASALRRAETKPREYLSP